MSNNETLNNKLQIKKLNKNAIIPTYGSAEAAGMDLYALIDENTKDVWQDGEGFYVEIKPHTTVLIGTGLSIATPKGTFGGIFARSGMATKQGLAPANKVGVCDSDYRGEYMVALHNHSDQPKRVRNKDRIAQLIIMPYVMCDILEVDELDDTDRGAGGFGSTGK